MPILVIETQLIVKSILFLQTVGNYRRYLEYKGHCSLHKETICSQTPDVEKIPSGLFIDYGTAEYYQLLPATHRQYHYSTLFKTRTRLPSKDGKISQSCV